MGIDIFFVDDSTQKKPSRKGMGALVGVGGIRVPGENVRDLERALHELCVASGFPPGPKGEFKWSPNKKLWMYKNLKFQPRTDFFNAALQLANEAGGQVIVVIEDTTRNMATDAANPEEDVLRMFLERAHNALAGTHGIVLADRPSTGGEEGFLESCLATLQEGTEYVLPDRIAINVISTHSHLVRLIQLADVVTSCTMGYVAGESKWSPSVFAEILPMFRTELKRKGSVGLKLHPDYTFVNLYHWLLGDEHFVRYPTGWQLPRSQNPYAKSPDRP